MKSLYPLALLIPLTLIISCNEQIKPIPDKKVSTLNGTSLIIGDPFNYGLEDLALFPVGANYTPTVVEGRGSLTKLKAYDKGTLSMGLTKNEAVLNDEFAKTEYINENDDVFDIRNILFRNLSTGNTYTLTNDTIHIISFALHREFKKPFIFYRIVKEDYNNDSVYNKQDGILLFTSDLDGKNFTQITPGNESFEKYEPYLKSNTILVKTRIDANRDSVYNHHDETNFREVSLAKPAMGKEIFSQGMRDSLRKLILPNKMKEE